MNVQDRVLILLKRARAEEQTLLDDAGEEQRLQSGTLDHWTARDLIAHVAAWNDCLVDWLRAIRQGQPPPDFPDEETFNPYTFSENQARTWEEIEGFVERTWNDLEGEVRGLSPETVEKADFPWMEGRPLWRGILGTGYAHAITHYAEFYLSHGDRERANELQESAAQASLGMHGDPSWQGVVYYNLACYYALSGQAERAIERLSRALDLRPDLRGWSKVDSDLVSLHSHPAFGNLVEEA